MDILVVERYVVLHANFQPNLSHNILPYIFPNLSKNGLVNSIWFSKKPCSWMPNKHVEQSNNDSQKRYRKCKYQHANYPCPLTCPFCFV